MYLVCCHVCWMRSEKWMSQSFPFHLRRSACLFGEPMDSCFTEMISVLGVTQMMNGTKSVQSLCTVYQYRQQCFCVRWELVGSVDFPSCLFRLLCANQSCNHTSSQPSGCFSLAQFAGSLVPRLKLKTVARTFEKYY